MELVILKIKPWMIKFKIDDKIYFVKAIDDAYEDGTELYQYIPTDHKGHYITKKLKASWTSFNLNDYITLKRGQTYRDIDKVKFWSQLAWVDFGETVGMGKDAIKYFKVERQKIKCKEKIDRLEKELSSEKTALIYLEQLQD